MSCDQFSSHGHRLLGSGMSFSYITTTNTRSKIAPFRKYIGSKTIIHNKYIIYKYFHLQLPTLVNHHANIVLIQHRIERYIGTNHITEKHFVNIMFQQKVHNFH